MRFYDELVTRLAQVDLTFSDLEGVTVFDGSHVADVIDALPDTQDTFPASAYDVVAPPFHRFFIESKKYVHIDGENMVVQRGLLFEQLRNPEQVTNVSDVEERFYDITQTEKRFAKCRDYRWCYVIIGFAKFGHDLLIGDNLMFIHLDNEGRILTDMREIPGIEQRTDEYHLALLSGLKPMPLEMSAMMLPFALFTITALHHRQPFREVKPTRQQTRNFQRNMNTKRPLTKHYVLEIDPFKTKFRYQQVPQFEGKHVAKDQAAHHRIGHFKTYTEQLPLMGKHVGTYYWKPEMRGDKKEGEVKKDYKVKV